MKRVILLIITISLLLTAFAATAPAQPRRLLVDNYVKEEMAKLHIPGAAVAILRDGRI